MEANIIKYFNRDISWLGFNFRVLLEAQNPKLPIYEKIKFLSIYSSNLDEFFRVRYPALVAIRDLPNQNQDSKGKEKKKNLLETIRKKVSEQQLLFGTLFRNEIQVQMLKEHIHLYFHEPLIECHKSFVNDYFFSRALSFLQPVILNQGKGPFKLKNNHLYFIVVLDSENGVEYALLNIPHDALPRFLMLPDNGGNRHIIFLDDVIRENINKVFPGYKVKSTHSIKLTRSADINLSDEWSDLFEEQIIKMLAEREIGIPSRLLYEEGMPEKAKIFLKEYLHLSDAEIIEGGRYHNLKDLLSLPNPDGIKLLNTPISQLSHEGLQKYESVFDAIKESDHLLHFPYQSYNYILRFFNEAAIAKEVEEIYVTLYRVASNSHIVNALISAAKNGKKVTAFIELKARFDEENNLKWAKKMKKAGVNIVYSIPILKVHSKIALVKRRIGLKSEYFALLSTGNFNEGTARFYTDHLLLTANTDLTKEIHLIFEYLLTRQQPEKYQFLNFEHLLVARFNFTERLKELVEREIEHAQNGKSAGIIIKVNNIEEKNIINLFYKASSFGVKIQLIVRGICCLVPGKKDLSDNISVLRIVDQYLEHSRVFIFNNNNNPEVFLGSADLMNRNLHRRIEVVFPVYSSRLKNEILHIIDIQLKDNVQAVKINFKGEMKAPLKNEGENQVQSQKKIYSYLSIF